MDFMDCVQGSQAQLAGPKANRILTITQLRLHSSNTKGVEMHSQSHETAQGDSLCAKWEDKH